MSCSACLFYICSTSLRAGGHDMSQSHNAFNSAKDTRLWSSSFPLRAAAFHIFRDSGSSESKTKHHHKINISEMLLTKIEKMDLKAKFDQSTRIVNSFTYSQLFIINFSLYFCYFYLYIKLLLCIYTALKLNTVLSLFILWQKGENKTLQFWVRQWLTVSYRKITSTCAINIAHFISASTYSRLKTESDSVRIVWSCSD